MRPNLSLYNKQWGKQWSGRRQVRCALISETVANWARVWAKHGFSSQNSPASLALSKLFLFSLLLLFFTTDHSPGWRTTRNTMSPSARTVRCALKKWDDTNVWPRLAGEFPPWRRWQSAEQNHGSKRYAERLITHINIALVCHHTGSRGGHYYHFGPDIFTWKHSEHLYLLCI